MAVPSAKITLFFTVLILVSISRTENVTVSITDTRLVWSGPNQYNTECGGVDSLMKNAMVSLNFTGEREPIVFVKFSVEFTVGRSRHQRYDQLHDEQ
jgi:hypothetical protein